MGLDVSTDIAYGIKLDDEAFAHVAEMDCDWQDDPPAGLECLSSGDVVFWYLPATHENIFDLRRSGWVGFKVLLPSMHDPLTLKLYDALLLDALRPLGFDALPAPGAWIVMSAANN